MVVFDSRWLDPEDPLYIKYKGKLVRNPEPPEYFIDTLPPGFVINGFAEMGFDGIVSWLKRVFDKDIIIPVQMSALLYKVKADTLAKLYDMEWPDVAENALRCLILDIWAEGIIVATKKQIPSCCRIGTTLLIENFTILSRINISVLKGLTNGSCSKL